MVQDQVADSHMHISKFMKGKMMPSIAYWSYSSMQTILDELNNNNDSEEDEPDYNEERSVI